MHPIASVQPEQTLLSGPRSTDGISGHAVLNSGKRSVDGMHKSGIMHPIASVPSLQVDQ